ncbi:MAG TPA: filamentous hemagglutinin N-terminal domain-containing protein, partial [Nitrospirales bacterium]|nr:filamentous hemagglutinin N-terminal domain-containing protein [Nitrospirales bacterium]
MPARKTTPTSGTWSRGLAAAGLMTGALVPLAPGAAWALPEGGTVASGSATVSNPTATSMRVDQGSDRLIMDWTRFNIAANESVRFQQPSAASIALNRVAGQEPSAIYGSLSANGQIFLINPSGILFSSSSRVDVGALTASTLNLTNQDFLNGQYRFVQDPNHQGAAVVNQGLITAGSGGYVALLGAAARNEGIIQANLGSIVMGAGKAATLDMRGDGLIEFVVTDAVSGSVTGPSGETLSSYVSNTGTLQADGGTVALQARAVNSVIKSVVNQEGIVKATSLVDHGGGVKLVA